MMILSSGHLSINSYGFSSSVNNLVKNPFAKPDQIIFDFFPSDTDKKPATTDDLSSPMLNSLFQGVDNREVCVDNKDNNRNGLVDENCSALPSSQPNGLSQLPPQNNLGEQPNLPQHGGQNPEPEICDGRDNDGDGEVDENCDNPLPGGYDNPEPEICGDGEDNNKNGLVDENCSALPSNEPDSIDQLPPQNNLGEQPNLPQHGGQNPEPEICDGRDNDGDGEVDENCDNPLPGGYDNPEPEICGDGEDNNKNGLVDENCSALPSNEPDSIDQLPPQNNLGEQPNLPQHGGQNPEPEICGDGEDNDGNGQVDENCNSQPPGGDDDQNPPEPEICGDGEDNDGDGQVDENCNDQSPTSDDNPEPEICGDGEDNDGDGQVDENCNDQSPTSDDNPEPEICGDGEDNDGDGQVDENCNSQPPSGDDNQNPPAEDDQNHSAEPEICGDGEDNDGNGEVDEECETGN